MTKLDKPLRRVVDVTGGKQIVVEIVPADEGIPAHIKFRLPGAQRSFFTKYIEQPTSGELLKVGEVSR